MIKYILTSTVLTALCACLISCNDNTSEQNKPIPLASNASGGGIVLKKFVPLVITGDFDGDKKKDTLTEHIGSKYKPDDFDSIADPFNNHWDVVTNWHFNRATEIYLRVNNDNIADLGLGEAQGLYCLINIGDNNADKKDEIALVKDLLDVSNLNTCKIFSICDGEWKLLKDFGVNESAFEFKDKKPVFSEIKNFLERKNKNWVYKDYALTEFMNEDTVAQMQVLKLEKCK